MSNEIALLNKDIKRFKGVVADLSKENKQLKIKLEKIKEYANQLEVFVHIKEDLLNIIEGAEDE